jgi:hypothetical protein
MDDDDSEDMLFEASDSQTFSDNFLIEDSDDEILFPATDDEPMLWGLPDMPPLTPARTDTTPESQTNTDGTSYGHQTLPERLADNVSQPVHDRYCRPL